MSTKTSIKRIALVAVSALGLGVLGSVAPAKAASVYNATMSASATTIALATGYDTATAATITIDLATVDSALVAGNTATVTLSQSGGGINSTFLSKLRFNESNAAGSATFNGAPDSIKLIFSLTPMPPLQL